MLTPTASSLRKQAPVAPAAMSSSYIVSPAGDQGLPDEVLMKIDASGLKLYELLSRKPEEFEVGLPPLTALDRIEDVDGTACVNCRGVRFLDAEQNLKILSAGGIPHVNDDDVLLGVGGTLVSGKSVLETGALLLRQSKAFPNKELKILLQRAPQPLIFWSWSLVKDWIITESNCISLEVHQQGEEKHLARPKVFHTKFPGEMDALELALATHILNGTISPNAGQEIGLQMQPGVSKGAIKIKSTHEQPVVSKEYSRPIKSTHDQPIKSTHDQPASNDVSALVEAANTSNESAAAVMEAADRVLKRQLQEIRQQVGRGLKYSRVAFLLTHRLNDPFYFDPG
jgi:hypothetical protein